MGPTFSTECPAVIGTVVKTRRIFEDVNAIRSDFVLQSAYDDIEDASNSKVTLLARFARMSPPQNPDDIEQLRKVWEEYHRLLDAIDSKQLATYIASLK